MRELGGHAIPSNLARDLRLGGGVHENRFAPGIVCRRAPGPGAACATFEQQRVVEHDQRRAGDPRAFEAVRHFAPHGGVHDLAEPAARIGVGEHDCAEPRAVEGAVGAHEVRAESVPERANHRHARGLQFVDDRIRVDHQRAERGEQARNRALARADPACEPHDSRHAPRMIRGLARQHKRGFARAPRRVSVPTGHPR